MLPLINGSTFMPDPSEIEGWVAAYPAVNVTNELLKMAAWLDANPKNRKTPAGIKRFCNSWLARAQDRGGSSPSTLFTGSTRSTQINADLVEISWVPQVAFESTKTYFLEKYGCYAIDGKLHTN
ncbi:hypothetical protein UFOVP1008_25 [uncultured Caudovirales phage]|uniref:Uncharacterized protein n=1 Tax=uncultured Caudovirales phage TaxID=2100421 RepID=A0A6J5MLS3_9CAUD|nr:hypothetical protein UFOVP498_33 [uncultured Caudovirales phage]CAB4177645.1 hypothetical protein UFOVP1008_25 [uncultured Caudovirales phage]CAB4187226.1 hypothetical protein UFOVP1160_21 [uncultured Caudovirales phage]CAB4200047.1 hypothetical protein UFOVP1352_29 [uncultured Caudovirales phage]